MLVINEYLDIKYDEYLQDSEVFYNGNHDVDKLVEIIGNIKGVRIA